MDHFSELCVHFILLTIYSLRWLRGPLQLIVCVHLILPTVCVSMCVRVCILFMSTVYYMGWLRDHFSDLCVCVFYFVYCIFFGMFKGTTSVTYVCVCFLLWFLFINYDQHLSVLHRCHCLRHCRRWRYCKLFTFSSSSTEPMGQLGTKHPLVKGIQVCSIEGLCHFARGDN